VVRPVNPKPRRLGAILLAAVALGCGEDAPPVGGTPTSTPDAARPPDGPALVVDGPAPGADADRGVTPDGAASDAGVETDAAGTPPTIVLYEVPGPVAESCRRYAEAQCARWKECVPARFSGDYGMDEICRARRESACRVDFLVVGRNETPANRDACTQAITAQSCRDVFFNGRLTACEAPPGRLMAGQACFRTSQCGAGMNCQIEVESCGTCQPTIAVGGDCGWWSGGCPLGTSCFDDRCLAQIKPTQACKTTSATCEDGLECTAQGCVEKTADRGAPCAIGDVCDPVKGLYCNHTSGVCEPVPPPVAIGQPCDTYSPEGARLSCGPDGFCFTASTAIGAIKRCVARADLGQPCDPTMGKNCRVPAACTRGICRMPIVVPSGSYTPPPCR
jgi:hypothetical protein